jgi:hypothetical protein
LGLTLRRMKCCQLRARQSPPPRHVAHLQCHERLVCNGVQSSRKAHVLSDELVLLDS